VGRQLTDSLHQSELPAESEIEMMDARGEGQILRSHESGICKAQVGYFCGRTTKHAQGGSGVVVPGCSICKTRLQTVNQFIDHLCANVLAAVEREL